MAYTPGPVPNDCPPALKAYLANELRRIAAELKSGTMGLVYLPPRGREPERPRDGMIAHADGVLWNPGDGAGLYKFEGGSWSKL